MEQVCHNDLTSKNFFIYTLIKRILYFYAYFLFYKAMRGKLKNEDEQLEKTKIIGQRQRFSLFKNRQNV
jgi:hypothetical protein